METAASRVVVFTGLPGTGKSTLADLTAKTLGAPAFAGDWLLGALTPAAGVLAQLDRRTYRQLYHGLLGSLVHRQLILGQSAIVDCLVADEVIAEWEALAQGYGSALSVIECICSDDTVHRSRVESRVRGVPGWHEVGWDHVQRMRAEIEPPRVERLTVDAVKPLTPNLEAVLRYLNSANADNRCRR